MGACLLPASGLGPFSLNQQEAAATAYYWANFAWRGNELNWDGIDPTFWGKNLRLNIYSYAARPLTFPENKITIAAFGSMIV